jgi:glycosyltransferase involved in cell wall biosynthesis
LVKQKRIFVADCILFSTADWDAPSWTNSQHTAVHLAKLGFRVLYVESIGLRAPTMNRKDLTRIWKRLKRGISAPRKVEERIWVFSPLVIPFKHDRPIIRRLNQGILAWKLKKFIRNYGLRRPIVWVYHPFVLDALRSISYQKLIYHCVDDLSAVPGIDSVAFKNQERQLLERCDTVFVTTDLLYQRCVRWNKRTYQFPNVVDLSHFSQARQAGQVLPQLAAIPHPRIGYIGVLSDYKIDFELIFTLAVQHTSWHWILIGEEREGQQSALVAQLRLLSNIHFFRHQPYALLPNYLRELDVGILPSLLNEYTRAMFPMKYFEFLAAGLPIVATPLEFTRTYTAGLIIGSTASAFAEGIRRQLQRGRFTDQEVKEFVGENTWEIRLQKMLCLAKISL